jgi:hypothetical protein
MKNKALAWLSIAIFISAIGAQGQSVLNGLIAYYPLNGTASDAAGTNHGTVNGAISTTNRFGHANAAYSFNGTVGSRIDFNGSPLGQVTNWTLSAWVRAATFSQDGIAVHVGSDNGVTGNGFGFGLANGATWHGLFSNVGSFSSGQSLPNTSQWHHVVMLRTNGAVTFFMNGIQGATVNVPNIFLPTDLNFGGQNGFRSFNGALDEVRIYNRALTSNEVSQLFTESEFCSPHAAQATAVIFNGFVVGANITDAGCGYTNAPTVLIQGGGGSNATATATISNGRVTAINITSAGCCYTSAPIVLISSPPFVPTVSIKVSKVKVTQKVMIGRNYVLESSSDLVNWSPVGAQFTAQAETVVTEVDAESSGSFFRVREVP